VAIVDPPPLKGLDRRYQLRLGSVMQAYRKLTIHKVQGSEFPCAVVIAHKSHSFMHHRNLLYTAVTRAKESVIIVGDRWGIDNCAAKRQVDRRNTFLSFLLHPETRQ
jgi:ATP-dependent exoDNAse (exonuclease V) alpha subunit